MKILGIESSCDETAASIIEVVENNGRIEKKVCSAVISSQIKIHQKYGGVVPEVAAREHVLQVVPVIDQALNEVDLKLEKIDLLAVTVGPGLVSSLMAGIETAKSLAFVKNIPIVGVNHIAGHIYAAFIDNDVSFPAVVLTVSGGHTILILMHGEEEFEILGETRDDAAGESFDKVAKMMNVGYPGGPIISKLAETADVVNKKVNKLPRPMINSLDFDFSFSGLKTAFLYELKKDSKWKDKKNEYAKEFEEAVVEVLISKTIKAAKKYHVRTVILGGGVSANKLLRSSFQKKVLEELDNVKFICPDFAYTTDNATMIAMAGYFKFKNKGVDDWQDLKADCNNNLNYEHSN